MSGYYPSKFAIRLCKRVSLYPKGDMRAYSYQKNDENYKVARKAKRMVERHDSLVTFQTLSTSMDFEEAMEAYEGIEISIEQSEVLKTIHASTFNWIKGKVIEKIVEKIEDTKSAKEIKELTETLIVLTAGETTEGLNSKKIMAYVVNTVAPD